jgi:hypothetical protein
MVYFTVEYSNVRTYRVAAIRNKHKHKKRPFEMKECVRLLTFIFDILEGPTHFYSSGLHMTPIAYCSELSSSLFYRYLNLYFKVYSQPTSLSAH